MVTDTVTDADIEDAYVLPVNAANLYSPVNPTSESIHSSLNVLMNVNSVGVAVELPLPATIQYL